MPANVTRTAAQVLAQDVRHIREACPDEFAAMAGRQVLMTGGAGFLGYEMLNALVGHNRDAAAGDRIRILVVDNFFRGAPAWIQDLERAGELTTFVHDIGTGLPDGVERVDFVIHAAGIASPKYYRLHPLETIDANINGLRVLLDRALAEQQAGFRMGGFLFFSSSEIYGDPAPEWIPTPEHYRGYVSCTGPRACYDESKRFGETLCVTFARQHGLPVRSARPFNNYGPGLKITDGRVIPDLARDVLEGRDLVLLSDGSPTRTFCYVADAAAGYFKVLVRGAAGEAYNIGVAEPEVTMRDLAGRLAALGRELFGYGGSVVRGVSDEADYLVDNPMRRCPDLTKSRADLGYDPSIGLDEGLRRTLEWYAENRVGTAA
jgi:nucleoside-diphosphate-sugar epimerase